MKAAIQKSSIPDEKIFVARELKERHFDPTWHSHREYQLFVVLKGTGTRFIGNTVKSFTTGDITFLGPGVPHLWRNDTSYFSKSSRQRTHGLVIYFREGFIGDLLDKEEMQQVRALFKKAARGIEFPADIAVHIAVKIKELIGTHGTASLIGLLQILDMLSVARDFHLLHNETYTYELNESETQRINIVYNYAAQHFHNGISLEQVSRLLNMTPTSFSRYFKMKTSKSFSDFLSELRIRHASKLLVEDDSKSISQISAACGFNTLSNFNRQFKVFMQMTPRDYRDQFTAL
ncbi:MAG: helix-turn-helix domain-containing protein [Chitinophagaceae bacterium]|nr:helix-turn-helix domain-containing protein [Chitinophagaceae bacterium]MCW5925726.1 helix-turn-helix domain-containing protein [Chitinophagaceae bacterium]